MDGSEEKININDVHFYEFYVTDHYIFYMNNEFAIFRINLDGTNKMEICECYGGKNYLNESTTKVLRGSFQIIGEWIYYQNSVQDDTIYKVRIDGEGNQHVEE